MDMHPLALETKFQQGAKPTFSILTYTHGVKCKIKHPTCSSLKYAFVISQNDHSKCITSPSIQPDNFRLFPEGKVVSLWVGRTFKAKIFRVPKGQMVRCMAGCPPNACCYRKKERDRKIERPSSGACTNISFQMLS